MPYIYTYVIFHLPSDNFYIILNVLMSNFTYNCFNTWNM